MNTEKKVENAVNAENQKRIPYEQLEKYAKDLGERYQKVYSELMEAHRVLSNINSLNMLLSVLNKNEFFDLDFNDRCAKKVQDIITEMLDASEKEESGDKK